MDVRSYWQASLDHEPLPVVDLPPTAEVVIIGAGVLGTTTALWLSRNKVRPLVIDVAGPAAGASGRNGGLLVSGTGESYLEAIARLGHAHARAIWSLSVEGCYLMRTIAAEESVEATINPAGQLSFALSLDQRARQAAVVEQLRADGFAAELLDRNATQEFVAAPLGPEVVGAKLNPTAATLHSTRLVHGLLAAALRRGAQLCAGPRVISLAAHGSGVRISTDRGPIDTPVVLVAANAWLGDCLPALQDLVTPVRGQALCTAPVPPLLNHGFGVAFTPTGEYGQQRPDGRIIFGGCRAVAAERDVGVRELSPETGVQTALDSALRRLFPSLANIPIERRWAGTMGFSPDYLPIAGQLADLPIWYAGGFSGHGMPFAAPLARALAAAALGDVAPPEMAHFRPDRPSLRRGSERHV